MNRSWTIGFAFVFCLLSSADVLAARSILTAFQPELVPAGEPAQPEALPNGAPSAAPMPSKATLPNICDEPAAYEDSIREVQEPACNAAEPSCDAEPSCGHESNCGGSGWHCSLFDDCCLGDPWTLKSWATPCCDFNYGGWFQLGYHSDNTGLSQAYGDLKDFNDVPDNVNLQQAWLYGERLANIDSCCVDWGYRADIVYGTDAQSMQAFGNPGNTWDNSFDHGAYGWAIPQAYGELGYNGWSIKIGHFFTPLGYEVTPATGNFFYSHSLTFFNSEPITHTGVLGAYKASDSITYYGGWTLGWDTGYDQFGGGSSWVGGFSSKLTDYITFTYLSTAGNFGKRSADEGGYSHSIVTLVKLSDRFDYVLQSDYLYTNGSPAGAGVYGEDVGIDQYLFYTLNDRWKTGVRMEWWKSNQVTGEHASFYELTGGLNYRASANVVIRPEIRYDWSPTDADNYNREIFGIDAIFTF